ncbi:hypothetical protein E8E13_000848 [Curvularia kusanoi]|uniref:Uncharacterized protein n=1 Tax=Curvularia kusanoi TaxID=90978 RepID=A0A9P4T863_CURKU|nr:hypothetical protein E8E13_000848 [Curvularia kusanoi]
MFFTDRSPTALGLIQSVELRVAELQDSSYSMRGDYPPDNEDYSGLKWTMDLYPRLCEILASPPVKLEKLTLVVEGWYFYMGSRPASFPTIEQLTRGEGFEPTGRAHLKTGSEPAVWIDPLLTITGLKTLSVCWPLTAPTIQRELETVLLMRQHMLRNGAFPLSQRVCSLVHAKHKVISGAGRYQNDE